MNVIYFDIDTLRPDHLGCYGYSRPTSPNIDKLASRGIRFNRCYAANNPCMPARAAIWSGIFGIKNGVVTHGPSSLTIQRQGDSVPMFFRKNGIKAATFSSFGRHPAPWFYDGWHEIHDPGSVFEHFQHTDADEINREVLPWLEQNATGKFFLHIHYWDPHQPLKAPRQYSRPFTRAPRPPYPTPQMVQAQQSDVFWHCAGMDDIRSMEDVEDLLGEYDAEIAYTDAKLGEVMDKVRELGIEEDTLVIVSSDHGEEFGEHGCYCEHWSVFEGTARVPLIVSWPERIAADQVSDALVYNMDISATAVEAFGMGCPDAWDAQSLVDFETGNPAAGRDFIVFEHGLYSAQRAVRRGDWKLIRTYHPADRQLPEVMLFNLAEDPWEQKDLAESEPSRRDEMLALLHRWEAENRIGDVDPLMENARNTPFGMATYAANFTRNYRDNGTTMRTSPSRRRD